MLYLKDQKVTFWSAEDKGKYGVVKFSSSRKDKKSDEWKNSYWSFTRFVGDAYAKLDQLEEKDRIIIQGGISSEKYTDKEGKDAWPKTPQIVVFNWKFVDEKKNNPVEEPEDEPLSPDDPDFPF